MIQKIISVYPFNPIIRCIPALWVIEAAASLSEVSEYSDKKSQWLNDFSIGKIVAKRAFLTLLNNPPKDNDPIEYDYNGEDRVVKLDVKLIKDHPDCLGPFSVNKQFRGGDINILTIWNLPIVSFVGVYNITPADSLQPLSILKGLFKCHTI